MKVVSKKSLTIGMLLVAWTCTSAHAGLVNTDLLVEGDKKVVLHEETGIEWMGFNGTKGMSLSYVESQMLEGGQFEGWRLPTFDEVQTLTAEFEGLANGLYLCGTYNHYQFCSSTLYSIRDKFESLFGFGTYMQPWYAYSSKSVTFTYTNDEGTLLRAGFQTKHRSGKSPEIKTYLNADASGRMYHVNIASPYQEFQEAVFIVSDGGETISSQSNPALNANNPAAVVSAPAALGFTSLLIVGAASLRRKKK